MRIIFPICAIFLAMPALAQTATANWIADSRTGCKVWNPAPQPNETISWSGDCEKELAQGKGVLLWYLSGKLAERYDGEIRDGKFNGKGTHEQIGGYQYEGDYQDGKMHGQGAFRYAHGARYEGGFRNNQPEGAGTFTDLDGSKQTGTTIDGCFRHGDRRVAITASAKDCENQSRAEGPVARTEGPVARFFKNLTIAIAVAYLLGLIFAFAGKRNPMPNPPVTPGETTAAPYVTPGTLLLGGIGALLAGIGLNELFESPVLALLGIHLEGFEGYEYALIAMGAALMPLPFVQIIKRSRDREGA